MHGIEIENYTVCRHERVARLSLSLSLRSPPIFLLRKNVCFLNLKGGETGSRSLLLLYPCHEFKLSCSVFVKLRVLLSL